MEGHWETKKGAPLVLFGLPDGSAEKNHFELAIPYLGSLILTHSLDGEVQGLKSVPAEDRPPVAIVFWSFRIMVAIGLVFIILSWAALVQMLRGRLFESRRLLTVLSVSYPLPFIAVIAGWFVTEIGRQPWVVYGMMRVSEALTPSLSGAMALTTLVGYIAVYSVVFGAGVYYLRHVLVQGLEPIEGSGDSDSARPKRPFSAVSTNFDGETQTGRS
jgi:cytochrome d ubiquinol oxidase subunit I